MVSKKNINHYKGIVVCLHVSCYNYGMDEYLITLFWDDEASVWIAESPDIPGLILESHSFDELIEKVKTAIPELLEIGGTKLQEIKLHFKAEHLAVVA